MQHIINPYQPHKIPESKERFFGRREIATWLEQQIIAQRRLLILHGPSLIGKSTLLYFLPAMLTLNSIVVNIPFTRVADYSTNEILIYLLQELTQQLTNLGVIAPHSTSTATDTFSAINDLLTQVEDERPEAELLIALDDFDALLNQHPFDIPALLDAFQTLLTHHNRSHFIVTTQTTSLDHLRHPLFDSAPTRQIGVLSANDALQMITRPVDKIIRFDYGVPKRIAEVNSNHPHYLTLFNHTLFTRHARDGWVNLRHLDETLEDVLAMDILSFRQIWGDSTHIERAVLVAMSSVRGTHGVFTRQEMVALLIRQDKQADEAVILTALETLSYRGILVKMGAMSYRFYIDLFRLWLQQHFQLADVLETVTWQQPAARSEPTPAPQTEAPAALAEASQAKSGRWLWALAIILILALLSAGFIFFRSDMAGQNNPAIVSTQTQADSVVSFATSAPPTLTPTPEPTKTATPTPPLVVAKSLPSIAYMARQADAPWQIYVMNTDGTDSQAITDSSSNETSPVWSLTGRELAFVSQRDGNREIYIMDINGQNLRNITNHPADDWTPAWSPDGSQIAFSSNRQGNWEIFIVDTNGDNLRQITNTGSGNISPVWSPDGERIVFSSKTDGDWEIYTALPDGTDQRRLTNNEANDLAPSWSPNGDFIAYETNRDGNVEIYVMNANGSNQRNITNMTFANDHGPIWSPDGQHILFYSNRDGNWDIFIADINGGEIINLTQTPDLDEQTPVWRP